ncbi:hypothetical protein EHR05_13490 [Leptospira licerasiae]|nr:hypothetical protein EHR05_13490 [Leptospira licerasiae]
MRCAICTTFRNYPV